MNLDDLTVSPRRSTAEHIAEQLRSAIVTGRLAPTSQLGEVELARRFAVSRGPVREALQRLVSEGLAHSELNRGVFVSELSVDDVIDVYRTRSVIERGALEIIVAEGRRAETAAALEPSVAAMRRAADAHDATAVSDADQSFHETLVGCSQSRRLIRAMRTLVAESRMCLGELEATYADESTQVDEHEELRDLIGNAPLAEATAALESHLEDAVGRLTAKKQAESTV